MANINARSAEFREGRKAGLALAALLAGIAAILNLVGLEKALLAIALGIMGLRPPSVQVHRWWAIVGIVLGSLAVVSLVVLLIVAPEQLRKVWECLQLLEGGS